MDTMDQAKEVTLAVLHRLLSGYPSSGFAVRLWDGTVWPAEAGPPPPFTLVLNHPGALVNIFHIYPPNRRRIVVSAPLPSATGCRTRPACCAG